MQLGWEKIVQIVYVVFGLYRRQAVINHFTSSSAFVSCDAVGSDWTENDSYFGDSREQSHIGTRTQLTTTIGCVLTRVYCGQQQQQWRRRRRRTASTNSVHDTQPNTISDKYTNTRGLSAHTTTFWYIFLSSVQDSPMPQPFSQPLALCASHGTTLLLSWPELLRLFIRYVLSTIGKQTQKLRFYGMRMSTMSVISWHEWLWDYPTKCGRSFVRTQWLPKHAHLCAAHRAFAHLSLHFDSTFAQHLSLRSFFFFGKYCWLL